MSARIATVHGDGNNRKEKHCSWWCAACRGHYEWRAPDRRLVVQISVNANEAKVFKAHAAPLGLSSCWRTSKKMVTARCKSIVAGLHERSRKGIMDGLRSFVEKDNHSALEVGHMREGLRPFKVQRPKPSEYCSLRAEEVDTPKA